MRFRPHRRRLAAMMAIVSLWAAPAATLAWNDVGHMLIAMVAWRIMDEGTRTRAVELLRQHPRFEADFQNKMPSSLSEADRNEWIFAHAATWPDIARDQPAYHHGTWHYINKPLFLGDPDRDALKDEIHLNLETIYTPGAEDRRLNAPQALDKSLRELGDSSLPSDARAVDLCWVLHIVGDLHQPLHTSTMFAREVLPEGDRGGNEIHISGQGKNNLHRVWDARAGKNKSLGKLRAQLAEFQQNAARWEAGTHHAAEVNPAKWIDEGNELCSLFVYSDEVLSAIRDARESHEESRAALDEDYMREAGEIAADRVVIAGHRLASMLKETLNP